MKGSAAQRDGAVAAGERVRGGFARPSPEPCRRLHAVPVAVPFVEPGAGRRWRPWWLGCVCQCPFHVLPVVGVVSRKGTYPFLTTELRERSLGIRNPAGSRWDAAAALGCRVPVSSRRCELSLPVQRDALSGFDRVSLGANCLQNKKVPWQAPGK